MFESAKRRGVLFKPQDLRARRVIASCRKLLSERGVAITASLAKTTLDQFRALDRKGQARFFTDLLNEFSPDPAQVLAAAKAYAEAATAENLSRLGAVAEPPRQELFRRLNQAPDGTATILHMRERLLELKREQPELEAVDADLRHLLSSWFNPGFLHMVRVDWRTPAYLLEQIIAHEAVHEIQGWDDLRRRLESDRRCYAFFHPALADEPLIFVEVALTHAMAEAVAPLLATPSTSKDPAHATTAVFYSISNCQPGLRGVALGNFLIKRVVDLLSHEFRRVKTFCTLSPVPGFVPWLRELLRQPGDAHPKALAQALRAVSDEVGSDPARVAGDGRGVAERLAPLAEPLTQLCATYLLHPGLVESVRDPVARFHLNNGARLERINFAADVSKKALRESMGLMVNYIYTPDTIEANHEKFIGGEIVASRRVRSLVLTG